MANNIVASIVYYNPQSEICVKNLNTLLTQFSEVIIFDNTEYENKNEKPNWLNERITYIAENKNKGIAYALNVIMRVAKEKNYDWVVSFDQDSEIPDNLLIEYSKYLNRKDIGILCSQYIDPNRKYMKLDSCNEGLSELDKCITSASCTSICAWEKAGKYDENLFIDLVDTDFSKRVKYVGLKVMRVNAVVLIQHFGVVKAKDSWFSKCILFIANKIHSKNLAKLSYKKKVSPMRIYYTNRNIIYLNKKHRKYGGIGYENYNCKHYITYFIFYNLFSVLRSDKKIITFKAVCKGRKDGKNLAKTATEYDFSDIK